MSSRSPPGQTCRMSEERKIIHCDCDCFYASIEMRDNPELADKPIAVGGSPERRGVVATCNYAARKFGIHSAMSSAIARKRCADLIIVRPDMEKYRSASSKIHRIFERYTSLIEPLSLDEAYLDVTECSLFGGDASAIARAIRDAVRSEVGITISAGIAPNKFLAKIASDWNKPDGQFTVSRDEVEEFLTDLPVRKLHGVGKVTAEKMAKLGIGSCGDLRLMELSELRKHFGSFGERLKQLSAGIDHRRVQTERIRKSVSVENTFPQDLPSLAACLAEIPDLMSKLSRRLERIHNDYRIHKQFIKIKFRDFTQTTVEMVSNSDDAENYCALCEEGFGRGNKPVRLLGVGVRIQPQSNPVSAETDADQLQLSLTGTIDSETT